MPASSSPLEPANHSGNPGASAADGPIDPVTPPEPGPDNSQTPGDFHEAQLESVRKSEGLATAAKKAEYNQLLQDEGMEATTPDSLLAQAKEWRRLASLAVETTNAKEEHTGDGEDREVALRREVEFYRTKARLRLNKHPEWTEAQEEAFKSRYFINKNIFTSRALAEQAAADIFAHAAEDQLPGLKPARLQESAVILAAYIGTESPQTGAQSKATTLRNERDAAYAEVLRLRKEIQLTADTAWPWHDEANLGRRREFLLPAGRAFVG